MKNELILFETADKEIKLNVSVKDSTVWLNRNQLAELFERDVKTIGKHINNALREELESDKATVAKFATVQQEGERSVTRQVEYYNLEMMETNVLLLFSSYGFSRKTEFYINLMVPG